MIMEQKSISLKCGLYPEIWSRRQFPYLVIGDSIDVIDQNEDLLQGSYIGTILLRCFNT